MMTQSTNTHIKKTLVFGSEAPHAPSICIKTVDFKDMTTMGGATAAAGPASRAGPLPRAPSFSGWQSELPPSSGIRLVLFSLLLLLPLLLLFRLTARMLPLPLSLLLLLL